MSEELSREQIERIFAYHRKSGAPFNLSEERQEQLLHMAIRSLSPSLPEGWVVVPMELTEEMRVAAFPANAGKLGAQAAYRAMLSSAPPSPQADAWVSVEERLPERHIRQVFCLQDDGTVSASEFPSGWEGMRKHTYITHWMSIPAAPQPEAKAKE